MNRNHAPPPTSPTPFGPTLALLCMVAIWAANFSISKAALTRLSPLAFNALRFPLAAAVVLIALRMRGPLRLPRPEDRARVVAFALLGNVLYQLCFIFGLDKSRAGTASILLAGTPVATAFLSSIVGHEKLQPRVWLGVGATVAGIAFVVWSSGQLGQARGEPHNLLGDALMVGATLSWSAYTVGTRSLVDRYGSLTVTTWMLAIGAVGVVLLGLPDLHAVRLTALPFSVWLAVAYAGALSIGVAYIIWHHGVRRLGNTRTSSFSNLVPVFAIAFAWLMLGEIPLPGQLLGAAIIIAGVTAAQRGAGAPKAIPRG